MRLKPYVVQGGYVTSVNDNDRHYVTASKVAALYRLGPGQFYIWHKNTPRAVVRVWEEAGLTFLGPRPDGKYELPGSALPGSSACRNPRS